MKLFRSGARAPRRADVIGMHPVQGGFIALLSNFWQALVRLANLEPLRASTVATSSSTLHSPFRLGLATALAVALASCGGGGGGGGNNTPPPPPPSATKYTIGGTVTGLSGTGLVLQDNGGDNLAVSASGPFTFATS